MRRSKPLPEFVQIVSIAVGYGCAVLSYRTLYPDNYDFLTSDEVALGYTISVIALWVAVKLLDTGDPMNPWGRMLDEFCVGTGIILIVDALLNYFQVLTRSLFLIVVGCLFGVLLLGLARRLFPRVSGPRSGILMIGFDPLVYQLASALGQPVLGVLGAADTGSAELPQLGDCSRFDAVMAELRPSQIVVAGGGAGSSAARDEALGVPSSKLLAQRLRGVRVVETSGLYEKLLGRVYCRGWEPADMVLSQALSTNSRMLAVQAVYTNLIGMFLLIALSPLLLLVGLAVKLFCGPGPAIETAEYCGFQNIPFPLMRFRTRREDGAPSEVGSLIYKLRLDRLPQLFQIVRGEMALFGPRPVRRQFARRLTELMPFYGMRFSVKPGILGWAQLKLRGEPSRTCELTEIEYDLYYVKEGSPLMDLDILMGTILGDKRSVEGQPQLARAAR